MWRKIRSSFILKKIFNNVDFGRKLNITLYNKRLQKKLGLNLIDFKRFSGKYKKECCGTTKIYNSYNDNILFVGYYSNGKKNGEGKEYNEEG